MTVRDALNRAELREAINLAGATVRDHPLDHDARFTLVDLLGFAGDWSRAAKQLDALAGLPEVDLYRRLVQAGRERAEVFATGERPPSWLIEPPSWAGQHLAGCDRLRRGDHAGARAEFDAVESAVGPILGTVGGVGLDGFRDLDDRLGPILELVVADGYHWVAWEDVRFLDVSPPETLRDLLWAPARLALAQGPIGWVHVPTIYPGSEATEGELQLGRATNWHDAGSNLAVGLGLKMALAGERSLGLFEIRELQFVPPAGSPVG